MQQYATLLNYFAIFAVINQQTSQINKYTMDENQNLNRIKVALVERQKTSKCLAEQLERSETTVSRWASNKIQPSVEQLFEIARVLNMDVKDLLNSSQIK